MNLAELVATKEGSKTLADVRAWLEELVTIPNPERINSTTCMARLSVEDARALFTTLKAAAAQDDLVAEALLQLRGDGLDLSHANARAMIDALFSNTLATKIKALGEKQVARWQTSTASRICDGDILEVL